MLSSGLCALDTARQFQQFLLMWHDVLDCSLQFLTAFFKTLYAVGEEEPKEELKKRRSAFDTYFKQNDKYLGGEPILLLGQRKEEARKSKSFFLGWALKSFALYTNQIIASQLRTKKITLPLDSHLSLILFHRIFLDSFFTFFDAHLLSGVHLGKCTQTTRMAGPPMKIFIVPLPPQLWSLWKLHKFIGVIVER